MEPEDEVKVVPLRSTRKSTGLKVGAEKINLQPIVSPEEGGRVVSARYPEDLLHALDRLFTLRHEGFPYETRGEFLRDCLHLGIEAIEEKLALSDHDVHNTVRAYRRKQRTEFWTRERRQAKLSVHLLREQLVETLSCEDLNETYRVLAEQWEDSSGMELDFWRSWYVDAFTESKMVRAVVNLLKKNGYRLPPTLLMEVTRAWNRITSPT